MANAYQATYPWEHINFPSFSGVGNFLYNNASKQIGSDIATAKNLNPFQYGVNPKDRQAILNRVVNGADANNKTNTNANVDYSNQLSTSDLFPSDISIPEASVKHTLQTRSVTNSSPSYGSKKSSSNGGSTSTDSGYNKDSLQGSYDANVKDSMASLPTDYTYNADTNGLAGAYAEQAYMPNANYNASNMSSSALGDAFTGYGNRMYDKYNSGTYVNNPTETVNENAPSLLSVNNPDLTGYNPNGSVNINGGGNNTTTPWVNPTENMNWFEKMGTGAGATEAQTPEQYIAASKNKTGWENMGSTLSGVGSLAGGLAGVYSAYQNAEYQKRQEALQNRMVAADNANKSAFAKAAGGTYTTI